MITNVKREKKMEVNKKRRKKKKSIRMITKERETRRWQKREWDGNGWTLQYLRILSIDFWIQLDIRNACLPLRYYSVRGKPTASRVKIEWYKFLLFVGMFGLVGRYILHIHMCRYIFELLISSVANIKKKRVNDWNMLGANIMHSRLRMRYIL